MGHAGTSVRREALEAWRRRTAAELGVPHYLVLGNAALESLAITDARDGAGLGALPGLGPRALAKHGEALLRLIAAFPADRYLLPMDQGDAEILERVDAGERIFRPGTGAGSRHIFESLVAHLRDLRDRGLIDMPERSVAHAAEEEVGAYLFAGPCYVTEAGRAALHDFRKGDRRSAERRWAERRSPDSPSLPLTDADRRQAERRRGDRRR